MTGRLLLALLALLTGFSLEGNSAQARDLPVVTTQIAAVSALATVRSAMEATPASRPDQPLVPAGRIGFGAPQSAVPAIAGFHVRVDRAHE